MSDFKTKMHQNRFRLGLRPQTPLGSLQRSPRPPCWINLEVRASRSFAVRRAIPRPIGGGGRCLVLLSYSLSTLINNNFLLWAKP